MKTIKFPITLFISSLFVLIIVGSLLYWSSLSKSAYQNPLSLSKDTPEELVTLTGKLILKLFPGPPEYSSVEEGDRADYCWVLKLDNSSFLKAITTPVAEPANTLDNIKKRAHPDEILLVLDESMENFCQQHQNQKILSVGYLFHAHTIHHYTPILMEVKELKMNFKE